MKHGLAIALLAATLPSAAKAGNSLVSPGPQASIAGSAMSASPDGEWNRLGRVDGKNVEVWTRDGDMLNRVTFFGGIGSGAALYREHKNAPLPKFDGAMLLPDVPVLFEATYRAQFKVNRMSIDSQEATTLRGAPAIRFTYSYVRSEDDVARSGEAVAAIVDRKLQLVTYEAPSIYFFTKDLAGFRQIVSTLKL